MAERPLPNVLQRVRKLAAVQTARALADRELLERFTAAGDEAAFTVLLERHGPMVLSVCRRLLGNTHDAEDACQATFLVLARKAGSVRRTAALGGWLHRVAGSIAANLRRERSRRGRRERAASQPPPRDPAAEVSWREVQAALDEEIQRLPDRYRAPLILCYLDGRTRDEAARQLSLSVGCLHGRLERARHLLGDRLRRRGLTLSAALSAAAVGEGVTQAALSPTLVVASARAATMLAAGRPVAEGLLSSQVRSLAQEVLKNMLLTRLKVGTAIVLSAGLLLTAAGKTLLPVGLAQEAKPPAKEVGRATPPADSDEDFIKRVSKDLRGTDPTPAEVHFFVASRDPRKRDTLVNLFVKDRETKQKVEALSRLRAHQLRALNLNGTVGWTHGFRDGRIVWNDWLDNTAVNNYNSWALGLRVNPPPPTRPEPPPAEIGDLKSHFKVAGVQEEEAFGGGRQVVLRLEAVHAIDPSEFNKKYRLALFDKDRTVLIVQEADFGPSLRLEAGEVIRVVCRFAATSKPLDWKRLILRPVEKTPDAGK
jgi:RNA polymerase sigma factor (sigma-70 family)